MAPKVTPNSIIYGLAPLLWRGLEAPPYDVAGFDFSHSQAEKRYPYIDGAAHDWTGLDPVSMKFTLYFINTLRRDAFPQLWEQWRKALLNGAPGELQHPLLGRMDAVPKSGSVDLKATTTAGVIVQVEWTKTLLNPEKADTFEALTVNAQALARAVDAETQALGFTYPTGIGGDTSFFDLLLQIEGAIQGLQMTALGKIRQLQGKLNIAIRFLNIPNHTRWAALALCRQLYVASMDMANALGRESARRTARATYTAPMTFGDVAASTGNTVAEILGLNLALARAPTIPAGTAVTYYR